MNKNNDKIELNRGKLWFQKIWQFAVGAGFLFFTLIAMVLASIGDNIVARFNQSENAYFLALGVVGGIYLLVILIAIVVSTIIFSNDRNQEIIEVIEKQPEPCRNLQYELKNIQTTATHLQGVVTEAAIKEGIIPRRVLDDLEGSVKKDQTIYIMTSRFILEKTDDFRNVIVRNFRKGVKYIYYIPKTPSLQNDYFGRAHEWYQEFSSFLNSDDTACALEKLAKSDMESGHIWNKKYCDLVKRAQIAHNLKTETTKGIALNILRKDAIAMFTKQLETYALDDNLFFVTVAMYEIQPGRWKAIIKLPTESSADQYPAFSVSGTNTLETWSNFTLSITKLPGDTPPIRLQEIVFD